MTDVGLAMGSAASAAPASKKRNNKAAKKSFRGNGLCEVGAAIDSQVG